MTDAETNALEGLVSLAATFPRETWIRDINEVLERAGASSMIAYRLGALHGVLGFAYQVIEERKAVLHGS